MSRCKRLFADCGGTGLRQNRERRHRIESNRIRVAATAIAGTLRSIDGHRVSAGCVAGTMRVALAVCLVVSVAACGSNSTAPSAVSGGTVIDIAGTWNGTIASSNNTTAQLKMVLTQSGPDVTGTWLSTSVSWAGQISG